MAHHSPLLFAPPALADASAVRDVTLHARAMGSDLAFANIYLLQHKYHTTICIQDGILYRHFSGNARLRGYAFPCGATDAAAADHALRLIEADAQARQQQLSFCLLTDADARLLQQLRPNRFVYTSDRGNADYLYRQTDLSQLPGTPYHAKRNHLARFNRLHPAWTFIPFSGEREADARYVADAWFDASDRSPALEHEHHAICHALRAASDLQLTGGLIYVQEQPIALALSSFISPEVADIHYEKCHPDFRDAYAVINHSMAGFLTSAAYINREEDMNVDGLRKAKLSYRPALLLNKWDAVPCQ